MSRAILFDLDGTLLDSIPLILASFRHTVAAHGRSPIDDDAWLSSIGQPLTVQLRGIARDAAELGAMLTTYREYFIAHHDEYVRAFPGIPQALASLKGRGVRMGVVSGKVRRGIERGLRHTGLMPLFDVLVGADDHPEHKPSPAPLILARERLGVDVTAYVGDAPGDMEAARRAGMRAVACLWGPFERTALDADVWLSAPDEIERLGD